MAYRSWKDIADITFNSTDLKAYVRSVSGIKQNVTMQEFHPAGVAWATPADTGMRSQDSITIEYMFDGSASGPNVKSALGTSSTLTITFYSGESITGTFICTSAEVGVSSDGSDILTCEYTPSGTITLDVTT